MLQNEHFLQLTLDVRPRETLVCIARNQIIVHTLNDDVTKHVLQKALFSSETRIVTVLYDRRVQNIEQRMEVVGTRSKTRKVRRVSYVNYKI
jgi:hypothetical protein